MSKFTDFLNLFMWDSIEDSEEEFNIDKALNDNWKKIDTKVKTHVTSVNEEINNFKEETNQKIENIQALPVGGTKGQVLTKQSETNGDANWEDIEANEVFVGNEEEAPETAKIIVEEDDFVEGSTLSKAEVYVGAEEPSYGEKVWFRKGKNILQNKAESVTSSGVTCSNNLDGSISISGTNTSQIAYCIGIKKIDVSNIKKGIYTISFKNDTAISSVGIRLRKCSSTGKTEIYITTLNTVNKSGELDLLSLIDNETLYIELDVILYNTINYNVKIYPQIQAGKETPYETYIEPQIFVRNSNGVYEEFAKKSEEVYSTEEVKIGTWIDGKPLYRKVVNAQFGTVVQGTETTVEVNLKNVDFILVDKYWLDRKTASSTINQGYVTDALYLGYTSFSNSNTTLRFRTKQSWVSNTAIYAIIEYTKTTD